MASATEILVINKRPDHVKVMINGEIIRLGGYQVLLLHSQAGGYQEKAYER